MSGVLCCVRCVIQPIIFDGASTKRTNLRRNARLVARLNGFTLRRQSGQARFLEGSRVTNGRGPREVPSNEIGLSVVGMRQLHFSWSVIPMRSITRFHTHGVELLPISIEWGNTNMYICTIT